MEKLTKDQRFTAYCIMLAEAELIEWKGYGLCKHSSNLFGPDFYIAFKYIFDEVLVIRKGKDNSGWWWSCDKKGWNDRIKLLKQCIIETHPE